MTPAEVVNRHSLEPAVVADVDNGAAVCVMIAVRILDHHDRDHDRDLYHRPNKNLAC